MAAGENAADKLKGMFKGGSEASEGLRQNINSFADSITDSSTGSANTADSKEGKGAYTTGMTGTHSHGGDGSRTVTGGGESEMGSSGFNKDAERLGDGLKEGIEKMRK